MLQLANCLGCDGSRLCRWLHVWVYTLPARDSNDLTNEGHEQADGSF
jgi:hypothetical protein